MDPSVYQYKETEEGFTVYVGEFSTLDGLSVISPEVKVVLIEAGAGSYQKYGWTTEKDFPVFKTVGDIIHFFKNEGDVGLIHFEVILEDIGNLRTHDDGECFFKLKNRTLAINLIKSTTSEAFQDKILAALLNNPGMYITIDPSGQIQKYYAFDEYLKAYRTG